MCILLSKIYSLAGREQLTRRKRFGAYCPTRAPFCGVFVDVTIGWAFLHDFNIFFCNGKFFIHLFLILTRKKYRMNLTTNLCVKVLFPFFKTIFCIVLSCSNNKFLISRCSYVNWAIVLVQVLLDSNIHLLIQH